MEQMNIAFVGHVDHGKSTVIGRLLADTDSLPEGKLEEVKERCRKESKNFEYAFLLDALKDEQDQGITIDAARCFFKSEKRNYIIIDAPGHIEFLKNMISGAARAEGAVLVIDANEGVKENSRRHGYMLSMLGVNQVTVCVNKMDLVDYSEEVFEKIKKEYSEFLEKIGVKAKDFIPVSGINGDNIYDDKGKLDWFKGNTLLESVDSFEKEKPLEDKPFRMPIQGVYKFTSEGDNRRIIAGEVVAGSVNVGDKVVFLPSHKKTKVKSIEEFNSTERERGSAGESIGVTLEEQIFLKRGEVMCKEDEDQPFVSSLIKTHLFWMGKNPMVPGKEYTLKLGTTKIPVKIKEIKNVLDASNLGKDDKDQIERHDVGECVLECKSSIAYDTTDKIQSTGRFVIVDGYDISGGGIITEEVEDNYNQVREQVFQREEKWDHSLINFKDRALMYNQLPKLVLLTGKSSMDKKSIAKELEKELFDSGNKPYFLGIGNLLRGLDADIDKEKRREHIRRLGEVSHILVDAGVIVIATASDLTEDELKYLATINGRSSMIMVNVGNGNINENVVDLSLESDDKEEGVAKILDLLKFRRIIFGF